MILIQMYNIFRLLLGGPDYSIVVSRMEENKKMYKMMGIETNFFFFGECCLKKNQNAPDLLSVPRLGEKNAK